MLQQINLYQPVFGEQRKPLSSRTFAVGFAFVIVALVGYSIYTSMQVSALSQAIEGLRAQQSEQDATLTASGDALASRAKPAEIEAKLQTLERTIAERRNALQVLESGAAGQPLGFAARMEALARRHVEGLWIDKLVLSGTNGSMSLSGATLNADTVPAYLQNLARENVLSGTRFDEFVIERPSAVAQDRANQDGETPVQRSLGQQHIRFRAGNKALLAPTEATEDAT